MRVIQIVTASSARLHNILIPNVKAELCSLCCAPDRVQSDSKDLVDMF